MALKSNGGKLMYDFAGEDLIEKLYDLCIKVRRQNNLQKGNSPWTINGLLRDLGKEIERKYDNTYP